MESVLLPVEQAAVRLRDQEILHHMMDVVSASPGMPMREFLRRVGIRKERAYAHLDVLLASGDLVDAVVLGARRLYPTDFTDPLAQHQAALLREEDTLRLYLVVQARPWTQADLVQYAEAGWGWNCCTTRYRLKALQRASLIHKKRGRERFLHLRSCPPHALVSEKMRYEGDNSASI